LFYPATELRPCISRRGAGFHAHQGPVGAGFGVAAMDFCLVRRAGCTSGLGAACWADSYEPGVLALGAEACSNAPGCEGSWSMRGDDRLLE
jgi:hypothetical protein